MNTTETLLNIAAYLGLKNIETELKLINQRSMQENASLILPLVGEFSSGKTTLINALTDSKKLETATQPTTATNYEVHFGCDSCRATVLNQTDEITEIQDLSTLKNETLADAQVVTVFDTSTKVPSSTTLVDTPGLSSPDPRHKQTLVNFLPKADGILLVIDINQQMTRSLTEFIETMRLSERPIYLVLTKADTKAPQEIEKAKVYLSENCKIPIEKVAVVSAATDNLTELYMMFEDIQKHKKDIIKQVDTQRLKNITNLLLKHIEELMKASGSDKELDTAIKECQFELEKIRRNIACLMDSISDEMSDHERNITRQFEDTVSVKLNNIVTGKSYNFDAEAISMINNTATLLINEYKTKVQQITLNQINKQQKNDQKSYLNSFNLDLSEIQISKLDYNLNLNAMGHEYDGWIKTGVIAAAAIGVAAAVASGGGSAVATMATTDNILDVADTVTDISSISSNQKTANRIERAAGFMTQATDRYHSISEANHQMGQQCGNDKGLIDSMVGFVTDKMMSKPQRTRAIRNYIKDSLCPEFKNAMKDISVQMTENIRNSLQNSAMEIIEQKKASLNQLKAEQKEKKDLFEQRMKQLREFQTQLLTL